MRRWSARIPICLLLGALTTVGVAWGCVIFSNALLATTHGSKSSIPTLSTPEGVEVEPLRKGQAALHQTDAFSFGIDATVASGLAPVDPNRPRGWVAGGHISAGWPWRVLSGERWMVRRGGIVEVDLTIGALRIKEMQPTDWGNTRDWGLLPLGVRWSGFLFDTLFFAAILLLFPLSIELVRRHYGHCPRCAYDLRGDLDAGCPECGWNRNDDRPPGEAGD